MKKKQRTTNYGTHSFNKNSTGWTLVALFVKNRIAYVMLALLVVIGIATAACYAISKDRMPDNIGYELSGQELQQVIARNSPMIEYAYLSPNADFPRSEDITTITIHHTGAELSLEQLGDIFSKRDRMASANYGIDRNGKVGIFVEEANRSWATGDEESDEKSLTIEVANDETGGNWHVSDETYAALINLLVDICNRNGIERLDYTGTADGTLIAHKMIDNTTECPGPYLTSRLEDIASQVNELLQQQ